MGLNQVHALGRNVKFFVVPEVTYAVGVKPVSGDAAKILSHQFNFEWDRLDRMDHRATRSVVERIQGRKKVSWNLESYLIPSGAAGTSPDLGPLFKGAFGVETVNSGTSVVHTLSASQSALGSFCFYAHMNDVYMESLVGVYVEGMTISGSGGEPPKVKFDGGAADLKHTGSSTLDGSISSSSSATVESAEAENFQAASLVKVGSNSNLFVVSRNGAVLTLDSSISASDGDTVTPYVPSETTAGRPVAGVVGGLTIDSVSVPIISYEINLKNNFKAVDDEAFISSVTDVIPGFREVTGKVTVRLRKDQVLHLGKRKDGTWTQRAISFVIGSTAGSICTVSIPYAEMSMAAVSAGENEATVDLPFKALGSSGEDELSLTWT
jgi:hypothetical protein